MRTELINQAVATWRGLQPRERLLVSIAGGFVLLVCLYALYGLLWSPLQTELTRLRIDTPKAAEQLQWMRAQAGRIKQLRGVAPVKMNTGSLLSFVEQSATTFNVKHAIKRMEPDGANGARVTLDGVAFNDLVNWLANLHKQGAIRVDNATLETQPSPGVVNARLVLRAAGA